MGNYNSTIRGSNIIITSTTTENNNLYNSNNNNNGFMSSQLLKNNNNENILNNLKLSSQKSVNLFKNNVNLNTTKLISDHLLIGNDHTLLNDQFIDDISSPTSSLSSLLSSSSSNNITQSIIIGATNDNERYNDETILNNFDSSISGSGLLQKLNEKFGRGLSTNEVNMIRNQITLGGTNNGYNQNHEDLLKQMEYDKFMNEIWIGIVLTLIVISLVFCICSCFLYHQFRQWKRNYRQNIQRNYDIESVKLNIEDDDDPVPNYTLVSGLPSYEAALELLRNSSSTSPSSSSTALLLPSPPTSSSSSSSPATIPIVTPVPSIFQIFSSTSSNEKDESTSCQKLNSSSSSSSISSTLTNKSQLQQQQQQQQHQQQQQQQKEINFIPSYEEAIKNDSNSIVQQNLTTEKIISSSSNNNCDDVDTKLSSNTI